MTGPVQTPAAPTLPFDGSAASAAYRNALQVIGAGRRSGLRGTAGCPIRHCRLAHAATLDSGAAPLR